MTVDYANVSSLEKAADQTAMASCNGIVAREEQDDKPFDNVVNVSRADVGKRFAYDVQIKKELDASGEGREQIPLARATSNP